MRWVRPPRAEIPGGMEAEIGVRGDADPVMGNRAENDGAGRGAQAVDDDRFARGAQALILVDIGADPAAAIIGNPHHRLARPYPRQQQHRCKQPRHQLHFPAPVGRMSKPNLIVLVMQDRT